MRIFAKTDRNRTFVEHNHAPRAAKRGLESNPYHRITIRYPYDNRRINASKNLKSPYTIYILCIYIQFVRFPS